MSASKPTKLRVLREMHKGLLSEFDLTPKGFIRQYNPFKTAEERRKQFKISQYSDRFIPSRPSRAFLESLALEDGLEHQTSITDRGNTNYIPAEGNPPLDTNSQSSNSYTSLLELQILSDDASGLPRAQPLSEFSANTQTREKSTESFKKITPSKSPRNILRYKYNRQIRNGFENLSPNVLKISSEQLNRSSCSSLDEFSTPRARPPRKIPRLPYKILDAPSLVDDFYLNLIDWSSTNHISIGLQKAVYIWSYATSKAVKIHETINNEATICSVAWNQLATNLAIGESNGKIKLYDPENGKLVRELGGHACRVGSISWNGSVLSSGSRDKSILTRDIRESSNYTYKLVGHQQEICGLKWSLDGHYLASGGNDNKVFIWSHKTQAEVTQLTEHTAAVKALAWSPHQHNLLATGGGKSDKTIKFWNLNTLKRIDSVETGSQVCNMTFSTNSNELLSTHGYSMNEICVWNYPTMTKVATLTGHTSRVLYLGMSPNGESIVSGAGDETLRFWNVFPSKKNCNDDVFARCQLKPSSVDLR